MNTDVIIIKGAPGSGKSETANILSTHFPKGVKIEVDYIRGMIIFIDWEDLDEHIKSLEIAANLTLDFLKFNYKPVIVIDTFSMGKEHLFINTLLSNKDNLNIKIFGLYVNEDELKNRLSERSGEQYSNFILSNEVNKEVINSKDENIIIIDTSDNTAEETANTILKSL
jgi:broad-specificity NMP kinase